MKTDYQSLSNFEAATICMIVVGFLVIGFVTFKSQPLMVQNKISSAFNILDLSRQVSQTSSSLGFLMDQSGEFYNQFYFAFTQVAVINLDSIPRIFEGIQNYADQIALYYNREGLMQPKIEPTTTPTLSYAEHLGKVLGASVGLDQVEVAMANCDSPPVPIQSAWIPYSFTEPKINLSQFTWSIVNLSKLN